MSPSANVCLSLGGIGLGLLLWVLSELEVGVPQIVLYGLLVVAVALIVVPWLLRAKRNAQEHLDLGELGPRIYEAHQRELDRRAQRIAKDSVDREEGR
jgi:hypothetical protein